LSCAAAIAGKRDGKNADQEKLKLLTANQHEIVKKMANLRMQMRALKDGSPTSKSAPGSKALKADSAAASKSSAGASGGASAAGTKKPKPVLLPSSASVGSAPKLPGAASKAGGPKEPKTKPASNFPEDVIPELCKYVLANSTLGLDAFKTGFQSIHPEIPKRQVELKIGEVFTKSGKNYVFKEGLEHLLHGAKMASAAPAVASSSNPNVSSGGVKRERDPSMISAPRKSKTVTAMSVFSKDQRVACEKLLTARPEYQAESVDARKQLLKDAVQAAFEALSEEALAKYTAKANTQNAASNEVYNKAVAYHESQMKELREQATKKLKTEGVAPAAAAAAPAAAAPAAAPAAAAPASAPAAAAPVAAAPVAAPVAAAAAPMEVEQL